MHPTRRRSGTAVAVLVACALTGAFLPALARKRPKPEPCSAARYLVAGAPIVAGADGGALELGASTAIDGICAPVQAKPLKATRKGTTQLRAHWKSCEGLTGVVTLQGKLVDGCARFGGTRRAKKLKRSIAATLSRCGDGVLDDGGGEECDDGNTVAGDGCEPTCLVTPSSTTTTIATGTTSTSVASTSTTAPSATTTSVATTSTTAPGATTTTVPGTTTTTLPMDRPAARHGGERRSDRSRRVLAGATASTRASVLTTLGAPPLGLVATVAPDPIGRGEVLTYELTVTTRRATAANDVQVFLPVPSGMFGSSGCPAISDFGNRGTSAQLDTVLTATLPPGTTPLATDGGTVTGSADTGKTVTWDLAAVEGGATGERRLRVRMDAGDSFVRRTRATIASQSAAAFASVATTLGAAPLGLVATVTPDPIGRGELLTYELTVTNRRATAASDVQVFMPVPAGMFGSSGCEAISDAGTFPGGCAVADDATWNLGTLAPGASRTVHATFLTTTNGVVLPDGSVVRATVRARDAAGGRGFVGVNPQPPAGFVTL